MRFLSFASALALLGCSAVEAASVLPRAVTPADITSFLNTHNTERAKHGAVALTWNTSLADRAQSTSDLCLMQHTNSGQNLATFYCKTASYNLY